VALLAYAASGLAAVRLVVPRLAEPVLGPLTGALTGGITAATGVFVVPAVPYLQAIGLQRDELVQALGLSFTVSTLALAAALAGAALAGVEAFAADLVLPSLLASSFPWLACGSARRCAPGCGRRPSGCASSSGFWRSASISHCVGWPERPMDGRRLRRYGPEPPMIRSVSMTVHALKKSNVANLRAKVSAEEWQARVDLAAAYRLVDLYGMSDLIANHISMRVPGEPDAFLINAYGLLYEEITASSLIKIDHEGNVAGQARLGDSITASTSGLRDP